CWLIAALGNPVSGFVVNLKRDAVGIQTLSGRLQLQATDLAQLLSVQRVEQWRVVDPVEELRAHKLAQPAHYLVLDITLGSLCIARCKAQRSSRGCHEF